MHSESAGGQLAQQLGALMAVETCHTRRKMPALLRRGKVGTLLAAQALPHCTAAAHRPPRRPLHVHRQHSSKPPKPRVHAFYGPRVHTILGVYTRPYTYEKLRYCRTYYVVRTGKSRKKWHLYRYRFKKRGSGTVRQGQARSGKVRRSSF